MTCKCVCHKKPVQRGLCICCADAAKDFLKPPAADSEDKSKTILSNMLKGRP